MFRFVNPEDYNWYVKTMGRVIHEEMSEDRAALVEPTNYFVDFLRYLSTVTSQRMYFAAAPDG